MVQPRNSACEFKHNIIKYTDYIESPILGFHVIKEMLQDDQQKDVLVNILKKSFGKSSKVQTIFKSMQQENQPELVYNKKWMRVPANTSITVSCKANMGILDRSHH